MAACLGFASGVLCVLGLMGVWNHSEAGCLLAFAVIAAGAALHVQLNP